MGVGERAMARETTRLTRVCHELTWKALCNEIGSPKVEANWRGCSKLRSKLPGILSGIRRRSTGGMLRSVMLMVVAL
jgi:hypothetical protein